MKLKDMMFMKVRDFIKEWADESHYDVDVYDNVCEEIGIAYCAGSPVLTKDGEEHFKDVLDYDIKVDENCCIAIIDVDGEEGVWQKKLKKAKEFFYAQAGYCAWDDYEKWFAETE